MNSNYNDSEQTYFISFQDGEERGFKFFFNLHYKSLLYFSKRLMKDDIIAEDLVEDSFLKLYEKRHTIQSAATLKGFLFTSVKNAALDRMERNKTSERYKKEMSRSANVFYSPVMEEYIRTETLAIVLKAIEDLPAATRKVVQLHYLEGKNYDEISKQLGRSKETVRKQKQLGILFLKRKLLPFLIFLLNTLPAFYCHSVI